VLCCEERRSWKLEKAHVESEEDDDGRDDGCRLGSLEEEGDEKVDGRDSPDWREDRSRAERDQFWNEETRRSSYKGKTRLFRLTEVSLEENDQEPDEVDHGDGSASL